MSIKAFLTAAAAGATLIAATAATAGDKIPAQQDTAVNPPVSAPETTAEATVEPAAPASDVTAPTPAASNVSATLDAAPRLEIISSQPVPDTRENRSLYGGPESRAGKMTAPRAN